MTLVASGDQTPGKLHGPKLTRLAWQGATWLDVSRPLN